MSKTDISKTDDPTPVFLGAMPLPGAAAQPQVWTWHPTNGGVYSTPSICDLTLNTAAANPATSYTVGSFPMTT